AALPARAARELAFAGLEQIEGLTTARVVSATCLGWLELSRSSAKQRHSEVRLESPERAARRLRRQAEVDRRAGEVPELEGPAEHLQIGEAGIDSARRHLYI